MYEYDHDLDQDFKDNQSSTPVTSAKRQRRRSISDVSLELSTSEEISSSLSQSSLSDYIFSIAFNGKNGVGSICDQSLTRNLICLSAGKNIDNTLLWDCQWLVGPVASQLHLPRFR